MLVLTWNIGKRVRKIGDIIKSIGSLKPDIVTLQEVAEGALGTLVPDLATVGLVHSLPSIARRKGNLILSRWPLQGHASGWAGTPPDLPFPELLTGATVDTKHGPLELITTHMPNGSGNGEKKIAHFRALAHHLRTRKPGRCVITGDFNSPRSEERGAVVCYGGSYRNRGQAWEDAEQAIIKDSPKFGMRDVFRETHGYGGAVGGSAYSHKTSSGSRLRLDHIFASDDLKIEDVQYEMGWLESKQSDHAALWARFAW